MHLESAYDSYRDRQEDILEYDEYRELLKPAVNIYKGNSVCVGENSGSERVVGNRYRSTIRAVKNVAMVI